MYKVKFVVICLVILWVGVVGSTAGQSTDFIVSPVSLPNHQQYETIPIDYPTYSITTLADGRADGYIFTASHFRGVPYLLVLEDNGDPVFYSRFEEGTNLFNFRSHPEVGQLSYFTRQAGIVEGFLWDDSYRPDGQMQLLNYPQDSLDFHDYLVRPNGNRIAVAYVPRQTDMRPYDVNGQPDATVLDFAFEEMDADGNLLFHWDSADHYDIGQANREHVDLSGARVDYIHGNAVAPDLDGNYLVTVRNYSEVAKISAETGDVMWRLGGVNNDFTFINDDVPGNLSSQHDTRRLENGNLLIFDNRFSTVDPTYTRVVEYELDEVNMTATNVWEYRHPNNIYTRFAGNAQRLPNGNTLIGWGSSIVAPSPIQTEAVTMTEIDVDGNILFEMVLDNQIIYRAYRLPWVGNPAVPPALIGAVDGDTIALNYSWNGATEVASYNIYADDALIGTQPKSTFEQKTEIVPAAQGEFTFQVVPVDKNGIEMIASNEVTLSTVPSAVQLNQAVGTQGNGALLTVLVSALLLFAISIGRIRGMGINA